MELQFGFQKSQIAKRNPVPETIYIGQRPLLPHDNLGGRMRVVRRPFPLACNFKLRTWTLGEKDDESLMISPEIVTLTVDLAKMKMPKTDGKRGT